MSEDLAGKLRPMYQELKKAADSSIPEIESLGITLDLAKDHSVQYKTAETLLKVIYNKAGENEALKQKAMKIYDILTGKSDLEPKPEEKQIE